MNKVYKILSVVLLAFLFYGCNTSKRESIIADNAKLEKLSGQFSFTEGPTADKVGNVYFTDQPNNKIYKYDTAGNLSVFIDSAGRSNGLYFDANDMLWACADGQNQLWKINPKNKAVEVILNEEAKPLYNGPNDVWVHKKGFVYFTDPLYQRPYWDAPHDTLTIKGLYFLTEADTKPIVADSSFQQPNGLVGDSRNQLLYVSDIDAGKTYRYNITPLGLLRDKELFVAQGSDGMTLDSKGNLYLTGKGVDVYNSSGKHIQHIDVPEDWTANVCFGGPNNDELFITASKSLYRLQMNAKGVE